MKTHNLANLKCLNQILQLNNICQCFLHLSVSMKDEYRDNMVISCGGMKKMKLLIDKMGISKKLLELCLLQSKSNNSIDEINIVESFWVGIWIGCFRFSHTAVVRLDEVLRQIFGWKRVASGTTFESFFKKFTPYLNHYLLN